MGQEAAPTFDANLGYRPTVSVVILSHRPEMLPLALRSVWGQIYPREQVEIVVKHGAVYHGHKLNEAIQATRGDYILVLPDDDELHPMALAKMAYVLTMERPDTCDFVYSDVFLFGGPDGDRDLLPPLPEFSEATVKQRAVPWMTFMARRTLFDRLTPRTWRQRLAERWLKIPVPLAPYDPTQQYLDWDLNRAMARMGAKGLKISEPLYRMREHEGCGHSHMNHGAATFALRDKHVRLDVSAPVLPPFEYPDWYEGRPEVLEDVT